MPQPWPTTPFHKVAATAIVKPPAPLLANTFATVMAAQAFAPRNATSLAQELHPQNTLQCHDKHRRAHT